MTNSTPLNEQKTDGTSQKETQKEGEKLTQHPEQQSRDSNENSDESSATNQGANTLFTIDTASTAVGTARIYRK